IVAGKPKDSLLIEAVRYTNSQLKMPPKGKLPDATIADLEKWIELGAPTPANAAVAGTAIAPTSVEAGRKFWSFQPPRRYPVPAVADATWPRSDIDRFILARQEA